LSLSRLNKSFHNLWNGFPEPVGEVVPTTAEEDVHAAPLSPAEEISIPIPEPVVASPVDLSQGHQ
jgi:hypothetical protein